MNTPNKNTISYGAAKREIYVFWYEYYPCTDECVVSHATVSQRRKVIPRV